MKNIIKKYYELEDETKDMLYSMNLFHEIENQILESDNEYLDSLGNEEKLLEIAITCSYLTTLDGAEIIRRLIEIINCRDISIDDIIDLTTEELIELISNVNDSKKSKKTTFQIIKKFIYNDSDCLFLRDKDNENYIILYKKDKEDKKVRSIIFDNIEKLVSLIINIDNEFGIADGT